MIQLNPVKGTLSKIWCILKLRAGVGALVLGAAPVSTAPFQLIFDWLKISRALKGLTSDCWTAVL